MFQPNTFYHVQLSLTMMFHSLLSKQRYADINEPRYEIIRSHKKFEMENYVSDELYLFQ